MENLLNEDNDPDPRKCKYRDDNDFGHSPSCLASKGPCPGWDIARQITFLHENPTCTFDEAGTHVVKIIFSDKTYKQVEAIAERLNITKTEALRDAVHLTDLLTKEDANGGQIFIRHHSNLKEISFKKGHSDGTQTS